MRFPYERLKKIHLTEKALADFNAMQSSPNRPRSTRQSTDRKTGAYDRNFESLLRDAGFIGDWTAETERPSNFAELKRMLKQNPIACSDKEYQTFTRRLVRAHTETKTRGIVFPLLGGDEQDLYEHEEEMLCHNFEPLVAEITDAKPDYLDGSSASSVGPEIRQSLSHLIVPSNLSMPILPNFFLEAKGLDGSAAVVRRQVLHAGSLGARGMHALNSWGNKEPFNNKASTISMSFCFGILHIYCTHPVQQKKRTAFHTNRIGAYYLEKSRESLAEGITAFRNARAWAKTQRDETIAQVNSRLDRDSASAPLAFSSSGSAILASSSSGSANLASSSSESAPLAFSSSESATLAFSSSESATLASSAALGPLQKQALSRNNKAQSNSNKRGIATEDKENIQKRQKRQKN